MNKIANKNINNKNKNIEIKCIKQEKSIYNIIVLHTGNIAASSIGSVNIYDGNNIYSLKEENYLLQKINFKKKRISYVYEFIDKTLLCSTYSKIYRLKLMNNDRNYNLLGIIGLEKYELPTQLISLGDKFLVALTELRNLCNIKVFLKSKKIKDNFGINIITIIYIY